MSVWTPELPLPRWLAFAQPALTWYQVRRDLADLTAELEQELETSAADADLPCAA
ncbi:MAG: hypothetical protein FWF90_09420 [Promicromonosporaceae bacterium]|nr:hypothetical protein [Promicromonosporaceae bacterium]